MTGPAHPTSVVSGPEDTVEQYRALKYSGSHLASFHFLRPYYEGRKVLDLGCAGGVYLRHFSKDSQGLDASVPNLEECRSRGLTVDYADLNQAFPVADGSFEVVFASHVLEHVDAPIGFLRECRRVLQPGGTLILGLPVEHSLVRLFDPYYGNHPGHLYGYSVACLKQLLERAGFSFEGLFVDTPFAGRFAAFKPLLHLAQHLPGWMTLWWCSAFWVVGRSRSR